MEYLRKFFGNFAFSMKIIKKVSRRYFLIRILFLIAELLISYSSLLLWRNIINALTDFGVSDSTALFDAIIATIITYVSLILIQKLFDIVKRIFTYKFNDAIHFYLDSVMIEKTADCDLAFFDSPNLKRTMKLSRIYILNLQRMSEIVFEFILKISNLVIAIVLLMSLNWVIVLIIVLSSIPSLIFDFKNRKLDIAFDSDNMIRDQKMEYYCDLFFEENMRQEIQINNSDEYIMHQYDEEWKIWNEAKDENAKKKFLNNTVGKITLFIGELTMYGMSAFKLIDGILAVGDVSYYISLLTQFRNAYMGLFMLFITYDDVSSKVDKIRCFLDMKEPIEKSGTLIPAQNPRIEFRNVSFRYPNSDHDVLSHCSFIINPGEIVGLVGLNGSGKSTIVKLFCRFYDPTDGQILIDGVDAKEYDIIKLRSLFGVLFQDYVKYSFSLRENIALSDISRVEHDAEILEAVNKSQVSCFIGNWEKGIDENMTRQFDSEGKELSSGQWQRVSLARAFFRDAPIVLLDEPSAALDPVAEHQIFDDFANISKNKSAILISHRLSSITLADKIIVLEDGHIIEQGSHQELIEKNGRYAYLFNLQANKYK